MTRFLSVSPRLPVRDLKRAIDFYTQVLGFTAGDPWPAGAPTFVVLQRDDAQLQFFLSEDPSREANISLNVEDALAVHSTIKDKVKIDWGPEVYWYGRREFAFNDPEGYGVIISARTSDPVEALDEG